MQKNRFALSAALALSAVLGLLPAYAQDSGALGEITVTARKQSESLQDVPDAISAFTSATIENVGITQLADFAVMTPNLNYQDGSQFRKGYLNITMRGIGVGQQGWSPVTYVVDDVRSPALDEISSGGLVDIERIEVLRGPQSALYGAGAIAGAINVITRQPTNDTEVKLMAGYGKGNDRKLSGLISGALVPDKVLYRFNATYRDSDGLIDSASNGMDLDFETLKQVSGLLVFKLTDKASIDVRGKFVDEENGSTYQDKLSDPSLINTFNDSTKARRSFPGVDNRKFKDVSVKLNWELPWADLLSVSAYSDIDQELLASICWDDPDSPAVDVDPAPGVQVGCVFNTGGPGNPGAFGSAALPGQAIDELFNSIDNYNTFTHDTRLSSSGGFVDWLVGAEFLHRKTLNGFESGLMVAPDRAFVPLFPAWHVNEDTWWGVYGQVMRDLTDRVELTLAARYDETQYENTQYIDRSRSAVLLRPNASGDLVSTFEEEDKTFQPKAQLRYKWTDDVSVYVSWSKGFRAGYFNTGAFNKAEKTKNIEAGVKSRLLDGRLVANASIFHIDYSDQQFSTVIDTPPFRVPVVIPESDIDGVELESQYLVNDIFTLSGGIGYLKAEQIDGGTPPLVPKMNWNLQGNVDYPWVNDWTLKFNVGYNHTSSQYLNAGETGEIDATDFVNLRLGVANENWTTTLWVKNATDERTATAQFPLNAGGYVRYQNKPVSYGVELRYNF